MAIFMVQNDLNKENLLSRAKDLAFPDSVVTYFKGMMGQPEGGFPVELQKAVLKGETPITCRPGELLEDVDLEAVRASLPENARTDADVLSSCMYKKVFDDYLQYREQYGDLSRMESSVFFDGMDPGETTEIAIEDGKTLAIKFIGLGEENDDGTRNVVFELNGAQRTISVPEKKATKKVVATVLADPDNKLEVGSNLPGIVSNILVKVGDDVVENQPIAIIEAMKMETNIVARTAGTVKSIYVKVGQNVKSGELLVTLE